MWLVALLAPVARSSRSTRATLQPERAAIRAIASPVTPPPSTSRSRSGPFTPGLRCTALCAWRRKITAPAGRARVAVASVCPGRALRLGGWRLGGDGQLGLRVGELVQLPVRLEVARPPG